ncbi:MAG: VOC family protein [Bacteroidales bacterium]|jgi:catechol 2,3-dioxygenase-like lactoylglutathione lyase family enzyme|nr:VOC family protein [Bacteroidales bacterium]
MKKIIYGIQQIGIGVHDADEAFRWYGRMLGLDVKVFDDSHTATHMAPYMGGVSHRKHAILAANMQGGSCCEIWQYTDRTPCPPAEEISVGALGIYAAKVKARNIDEAYAALKNKGAHIIGDIVRTGDQPFFFMNDGWANKLQIVEAKDWFGRRRTPTGGVCGCIIGVSDVERSLPLYSGVLGYSRILSDETGVFPDLAPLKGGYRRIRRVLLARAEEQRGSMAALLGHSRIELVQSLSEKPDRIFEGRFWGDLGFIHLCFDIYGIEALKAECAAAGFPFTVESDSAFKMGDAAGHWSYLEDPDGTLIEFVETKKIPLMKKWNWYLHLEKRDPHKPLPRWLISALALNRVKIREEDATQRR